MKKFFTLLFMWALCAIHTATLPSGFTETRLATGLDPTGLTALADGRIFVTIKSGKILVIKNEVVLATPLLTIPNLDNWNERGLQTVILDPDFSTNHYIYAYYCYKNPSTNISNNRVSRFSVVGDVASASSEVVLINFDDLSSVGWHNGGGLIYAPDGKLYISTGENNSPNKAQSLNTLLGKVLRINPDGTIPTDNPFYNTLSGSYRAIYALGFRNPFKLNLQPGTGKIYVNDVGQGTWEEINDITAGSNYGWPGIEGKRTTQTAPDNYVDPVYAYNHSNGTCSITGGNFYNPAQQQFPSNYAGKYFFADYCAGWIRYIDPANNYALSNFATGIDRPLDIDVDTSGNFYYIARGGLGGGSDADNTSSNEGELWRVTYTGNGAVSVTVNPLSKTVATGTAVSFVVGASGTAPLAYRWQRNGVDLPNANTQNYTIPVVALSDSGARFRAIVSNASSADTSTYAILSVIDNTAPVAEILTPITSTLYEAGTTISFSGLGNDAEDGSLPAAAYTWRIDFHHDEHTHPALDPVSGLTSGTFYIPDEGEVSDTVWYRIYLTVTDALGTQTTVYREIYPKKVDITLSTSPKALPLLLDGAEVNTPITFRSVVGLKHTLEAHNIVAGATDTLSFSSWSQGGDALQILKTPSVNTGFTANYEETSTAIVKVLADAYVRSGSYSNNTLGISDSAKLVSKLETNADVVREIYLKFDVGAYADVYSAKLRLYGSRSNTDNSNVSVQVFEVKDTLWNERTINFSNKPVASSTVLGEVQVDAAPAAPQYYEWDLSAYVKGARQAGRRYLSFKVSNPEITSAYVSFNAKEALNNVPQLLISYPKVVVGVNDQESATAITVYPNPATTLTQLYSNLPLRSVQLLNAQGQCVYTQPLYGQTQVQLDLQGFESGFYQVKLIGSDQKAFTRSLVIQK